MQHDLKLSELDQLRLDAATARLELETSKKARHGVDFLITNCEEAIERRKRVWAQYSDQWMKAKQVEINQLLFKIDQLKRNAKEA